MMALRTSLKDAKNVEVADDIAELFLAVRRSLALALSALLEKGITQGIWRPSGDPLHTTNFILDTI